MKSHERSLIEYNFNSKIIIEKLLLENRYLSDRIANTEKLLETRFQSNVNKMNSIKAKDSTINASIAAKCSSSITTHMPLQT